MKNEIGKILIAAALFWIAYEFHIYNETQKIEFSNGQGAMLIINKKTGKVYRLERNNMVEEIESLYN